MGQDPMSAPQAISPYPSDAPAGLVSHSPQPGLAMSPLSRAHILAQPLLGLPRCPLAALLLAGVVGLALAARPCPAAPWGAPASRGAPAHGGLPGNAAH